MPLSLHIVPLRGHCRHSSCLLYIIPLRCHCTNTGLHFIPNLSLWAFKVSQSPKKYEFYLEENDVEEMRQAVEIMDKVKEAAAAGGIAGGQPTANHCVVVKGVQNGAENRDLRCVLRPSTQGAGCKTRLESRLFLTPPPYPLFMIDF